MSTSTVSITANPAATRRRPMVAGEKKSGIEMVAGDDAAAVSGGDDKLYGGGVSRRDLSHSLRGEAVLERSRDVVQIKKALPTAAAELPSRRTSRKGVSKPEKPRWQTVLSIFTKNFLLLLVLLGLILMIRKLAIPSGGAGTTPSMSWISEFEGRIAEMEGFLKTTTKMMQVQVEIVDQKIENEIGSLRRDLSKEIEDKGLEFAKELKKLDGRTESLEKSLSELSQTDWLAKHDFGRFFDEFKKARGLDHGVGDENLDDLRAYAREIVESELEKHAADGLGRVDYALASGGAMVTKHSEPYNVGRGSNWFYKVNRNGVCQDAEKMLKPSFGEPGLCFPLKGSRGFVQVRLRTAIIPDAITLEHVAKSVAYDRSSAPKDCRVSGWLQGKDPINQEKIFLLTEFTYDLEKSNSQTFDVLESVGSNVVDTISFDFTSNHGSPSHTCIYRLRVHGREPKSVSMVTMQS